MASPVLGNGQISWHSQHLLTWRTIPLISLRCCRGDIRSPVCHEAHAEERCCAMSRARVLRAGDHPQHCPSLLYPAVCQLPGQPTASSHVSCNIHLLQQITKFAGEASTAQMISTSNALIKSLLPFCKIFDSLDESLFVLLLQPLVTGIAQMAPLCLQRVSRKLAIGMTFVSAG